MIVYYHRDFDGIASAAILAEALEATGREKDVRWSGVNFDRTLDWERFGAGQRFALVDFHYHPRAIYWFDHHPTAFLEPAHEAAYRESDTHKFDPAAPSCPPIILGHAKERWGFVPPPHFDDLVKWSNVIDAARFGSAEQALFGREPAIRVARAMTCAPDYAWHDRIVHLMRGRALVQVAADSDVERLYERSSRNRDHALEAFPSHVLERTATSLFADLRSKKIRRERFAPFYLHPELHYAVTLLPTRAGVHITAASNPWNRPPEDGIHLGELMKEYGGGGHKGVGGCNPPDDATALLWGHQIYRAIRERSAAAARG